MADHDHDEITRRNMADTNFRSILAEFDETVRVNREQRAKAHGFSTYDEYEAVEAQKRRIAEAEYETRIEEGCKRLGKTVEQYWEEHPQRWVAPEWLECDCDGVYCSSIIALS